MDSIASLVLFTLLIAFVGDAAASCRKMANEEMLEYFCEYGDPLDLATVPEITEKLRIMRMPLHRITADTFARFGGNLWVLSCSHCEITDIDADAFRRLVNLQQLSLDNNYLTTVKASWFEGLEYLTYLDLNYNNIYDIEDGVYKNLPSLVDLRISGNRLRCLNLDEMSYLRELKRMFLSENSDFACPHAVSKFLENQGVAFEKDPEWERLASDTIDVYVPPNYVEEDKETVPAHRERLHPGKKPPLEESQELYPTRDKAFYPDNSAHRSHHRKPTTTTVRPTTKQQEGLPLPRVEPIFPETKPSHISLELSHQVMPYPYSTQETSQIPLSEDIEISVDEPSRMEHTYPIHETTPHWSYPTSERSRTPPVILEDKIAGTDRSQIEPQTERMLTYISTYETIPYPPYPTSERSRVGSSEDEKIGESGRPSQAGNTVTYPLYGVTSDGLEKTSYGSIQLTRPSTSDLNRFTWTTDDPIEHPINPLSWTPDRHEQSRPPAGGNDRTTSTRTPYYGHDPRKMIAEESLLVTDDYTPDLIEYGRSQTTTSANVHYVRPSPPKLMHSTNEYQTLYKSTVYPPLQNGNVKEDNRISGVSPLETTTDRPLPECPENSASKIRPAAALVTFIVVIVLGHTVVERF